MTRLRQAVPLGIRAERRGPCHILFLSGELDLTAGPVLERHIWRTWDPGRCPDLILDLSGIEFCDSCGAASLIRLLKRANRAKGRLTLSGVPQQILRRLRIMGVLGVFQVCEDAEQAATRPLRTA